MLAPKNPVSTESEQVTAYLNELSNMIKESPHSDDLE